MKNKRKRRKQNVRSHNTRSFPFHRMFGSMYNAYAPQQKDATNIPPFVRLSHHVSFVFVDSVLLWRIYTGRIIMRNGMGSEKSASVLALVSWPPIPFTRYVPVREVCRTADLSGWTLSSVKEPGMNGMKLENYLMRIIFRIHIR